MAPLSEQAADEPADRSQTQTCGHQSGTAHALHDPRLPDEGAARWMRHTHRIVSTMRFHRYRQKAKSGPYSGTRRTRPALPVNPIGHRATRKPSQLSTSSESSSRRLF